jgi:hypothetical protein
MPFDLKNFVITEHTIPVYSQEIDKKLENKSIFLCTAVLFGILIF